MQGSVAAFDDTPFHINPDVAKSQDRMVLGTFYVPAQQCADASQQLSGAKRFHQIVICTRVQGQDLVRFRTTGRQHNDRHL
ncbi:hypothetical protein D3C87_1620160 [compost metagenome]